MSQGPDFVPYPPSGQPGTGVLDNILYGAGGYGDQPYGTSIPDTNSPNTLWTAVTTS